MQQASHIIYSFGDFTLDLTTSALLHKGQEVKLRPKAFDALRYLVENPNRLVSKDELVAAVWADTFVTDDSLVKCLKDVRRALEDDAQQFVKTVPRRGYIFVAKVSEQGRADANVVYAEEVEGIRVVIREGQRDGDIQEEVQAAVADSLSAISRTDRPHLKISRKTLLATALVMVLVAGLIYLGIVRKPEPPPVAMVKSMAVLPFLPLGEQNRNEVLTVGLADSLITKLSKIKQLTVRPTSAVLKYAGSEQDVVTVGRTLQVDAVLESRVQQVGDHLKINSQLVRVEDGKVIWSFQCDDLCVDILTLQESVSESIARELKFNLTSEEQKLLTRRYTDNAEVYQLYLNGRAERNKRTRQAVEKAIDYFQQALEREPNYAPAYSGLADCYIALGSSVASSPPRAVFPKAKYAAERAIDMDDTLAEAHASLGFVLLSYDWDFVGAKREFERAIELDPKYALAHLRYAHYLTAIGHHEEAIREMRLACELDPTSAHTRGTLGWLLYHARQYDQAIEQEKMAQELGSRPYMYRFSALIEMGRYEEAVEFALHADTMGEKPEDLAALKAAFQAGGIRGFWEKDIEQVAKAPRHETGIPKYLAYLYSYLGEKDKAFASLEKMVAERDGYVIYLQVDPRYDNLRSDRRFQDLLRRVGLAP